MDGNSCNSEPTSNQNECTPTAILAANETYLAEQLALVSVHVVAEEGKFDLEEQGVVDLDAVEVDSDGLRVGDAGD